MIAQVTKETETEYLRRLGQTPFFSALMHTVYRSCEGKGVQCFLVGRLSALQVCGQCALLCGQPEDEAELASFLSFLGIARLKTQGCCPQGFVSHALPLLRYDEQRIVPVPALPAGMQLETQPSLIALCRMAGLSDGTVPPDAFAADAAARRNRGLADIRALSLDGELVATAGVYALQPWEAYLGAVATSPLYRRRGCAGYLVSLLARTYASRPVRLICEEALVPFYAKLGFAREALLCDCVLEKDCENY